MQSPTPRATVNTMPIRDGAPSDRGDSAEPRQADAHAPSPNQVGTPATAAAFDSRDWLSQATGEMRESFARNRRVISFAEYITLFSAEPAQQLRSAAQYLRDVFDHFGTEPIRTPRGPMIRWKLFDCPWDSGKDALVGQEEVQAAVYRLVANFAREGRTNRLILLHGPNGSAKSTFVACLQRAMEHYSTREDGALYKFNWIFPSQKLTKGGIGFGGGLEASGGQETFAYLEDELVESKIVDEMRDHPLLLLPRPKRRELIAERLASRVAPEAGSGARPELQTADYLVRGDLSHRNRQIFEALLSSYHGDLSKVLRHVQVERFFVSRRYRQAAATVEPQLAVDARSRQLTMDRSLGSLPPALQSLTLYEYQGELVDGNRGVVDFADLLKRPLESYKYLLGTVEQGRVSLDVASLELDTVFIGSSNEGYLAAFKEIPEFQSFKGRMELVRVPYLLDYRVEQRIYEAQIRAAHTESARHVAPHVAWVTALWAALTRMKKPLAEKYGKALSDIVAKLGPMEKAQLYADNATPGGADHRAAARSGGRDREDRARVGQLPQLRRAHRRLAARDEADDHERRAEHAVQVPLAVRGVRRAGGAGARRDRLRVPQAGAAAGRFSREPEVHLPGARQADRSHRRRGADLDGPRRGAALHRPLRALRHPRLLLGQEGEGPQPHHGARRGPRRGDDGRRRADPAGLGQARRVPARGDHPDRRLVDRPPAPEAGLRADLSAPDRRAARVVLRGAQEAGPQDQRGSAGADDRRRRPRCSPTRRRRRRRRSPR